MVLNCAVAVVVVVVVVVNCGVVGVGVGELCCDCGGVVLWLLWCWWW